jgi:DNA-directed RNA polymerase specialized sigma24 family protein
MDVDGSFAEYVAARWSMLYRLAALLVGEPDADDLTQEALVRAYLVWPDVEAAASADDHVRTILASTAVQETKDAPVEPDSEQRLRAGATDRDKLWAAVSELTRRQRAVLVLRHYESLDDAEIGRTIKRSLSEVRSEAAALEAGIDLADLRDELYRRAEDVIVPLPPIAALVAQGHQARHRRARRAMTRGALVAAVVVVGVALATLVQGRSSDTPRPPRTTESPFVAPQFVSQLPRGRPADIAYTERRFLHLAGGRGVPLGGTPATIVQTPGWAFVAYLSGKIVRVNLSSAAMDLVAATSGGQLATDSAGRQVAWLSSGSGKATVVLASASAAASGRLDGVQSFPVTLRCCDNPFEINGITDDGQLVASLPAQNRAWVWDTRGNGHLHEISGLGNGVIGEVTATALVAFYPPSHYALGQVQDDVFLQSAELAALHADYSDPLGHRIVYADNEGDIHVREINARGRSRRPAGDIRMRLPTLDDGFADLRWEDGDHVLLDVYDESMPDGALVRCDVGDGACELADDLEGPHLLPR